MNYQDKKQKFSNDKKLGNYGEKKVLDYLNNLK